MCVVHAKHMCNVCELVHLWFLRFSNGCHSLHLFFFLPHDVTTASPPSPHFHHPPIAPPPLLLLLLLTAAAWGSSLLKKGWIIIQTSPLASALR